MSGRQGFDPAEARRLIDQVQRLGANTAKTVVHRFARMVEGLGNVAAAEDDRSPEQGPYEGAVVAMIDAGVATARAVAAAFDAAMSSSPPADGVGLRLRCRPGAAGSASMWVHNTSSRPVGDATIRASDLVGVADRIVADAVRFEPPQIPGVGARDSVEVVVTVDPGSVRPGIYTGLILVPAVADLPMMLIVTVEETA